MRHFFLALFIHIIDYIVFHLQEVHFSSHVTLQLFSHHRIEYVFNFFSSNECTIKFLIIVVSHKDYQST